MSDSSQTEENSQKRKSDIPVAVVKPIEKKKRRTKNCLLCSVHGIDVAVNNHSRYCKYMQDITSGVHWCVKCNYVFQRRINMAILTQQKRNRDKDNEKLNGQLDKDEIFPDAKKQNGSFICQIYFKIIAKMQERQKNGNTNPLSKDEILDICKDENNPDKMNDFMMEACNSNSSVGSSKSTKTLEGDTVKTNKPPIAFSPQSETSPPELSSGMQEKILIKTWEMLSHQDYYSLLSKMTVYSWLYLIMKENDGDINSAMNMIIRGSRESGKFNQHLSNITSAYNETTEPVSLPAQLYIHTSALRRPVVPLEMPGGLTSEQKILYSDRFEPGTSSSFGFSSLHPLHHTTSPYFFPFNIERNGHINDRKHL